VKRLRMTSLPRMNKFREHVSKVTRVLGKGGRLISKDAVRR